MSKTRNAALAWAAKERQPFCSRCFSTRSLHAHHIVALADGGEDALTNLDVLCERCHFEWHSVFEAWWPYAEFVTSMPSEFSNMGIAAASGGTAAEVQAGWRRHADATRAHLMANSAVNPEMSAANLDRVNEIG